MVSEVRQKEIYRPVQMNELKTILLSSVLRKPFVTFCKKNIFPLDRITGNAGLTPMSFHTFFLLDGSELNV
jgi:hypothetical protein